MDLYNSETNQPFFMSVSLHLACGTTAARRRDDTGSKEEVSAGTTGMPTQQDLQMDF